MLTRPHISAGAALILLSLPATGSAARAAPYQVENGAAPTLKSPAIAEASGLVASTGAADRYWLVNDSGGTPELHRTDASGTDLGRVTVTGAKNIDWEDLSAFKLEGRSWLLIGDIGDNGSRRRECRLLLVPEPGETDRATEPVRLIRFTYGDGPRDCESLAVDASTKTILLVGKRTTPPPVYELPLVLDPGPEPLVAKRVGEIRDPMPAGMLPYGSQPTGLALSPDGRWAAVATYHRIYLFPRPEGKPWAAALGGSPAALPPHRLGQIESVCFSSDGSELLIVPEGKHAPLLRYSRKP